MKITETVVINKCDRCNQKVDEVYTFYGEQTSVSTCNHAEQFDLCISCKHNLKEFMRQPLPGRPPTSQGLLSKKM